MRSIRLTSCLIAGLVWANSAQAWNEVGYRLSVGKAVEALPKQMKKFYEERRADLVEKVLDPARLESRPRFEIDRLEVFPFEGIPETREAAVAKYGEDKIREAGDLPWRLVETYGKLVEAFRSMDVPAIESVSAELAYCVGELNGPLNVSKYGDGEPTGQEGLRERFDSRLLEVYGDKFKLGNVTAIFLDRPAEYAFSIPRKAYVWVDNILLHDYIARMGVASYDRFYYDGLWLRASSIISQVLEAVAQDMASFWYTAWVTAGKPELQPTKK